MTVFDDLFHGVGFPALLDQFGEDVVYVPLRGEPRTIRAIVDRNPPVAFDPTEAQLEELSVSVFNNPKTGISSSSINTGGDKIEVSRRKGREAKRLSIVLLEDDSGGTCVLRVR